MLKVNENKQKRIEVSGYSYDRYALKTPVITEQDDLDELLRQVVAPQLEKGDLVFMSEKMVACTQGRAFPLSATAAQPFRNQNAPRNWSGHAGNHADGY